MCHWLNISRSNYYCQTVESIAAVVRLSYRCIMEWLKLVSVYQNADFKPHSKGKNATFIPNMNRQFNQEKPLEAIVMRT